jgi:hypothetical protein
MFVSRLSALSIAEFALTQHSCYACLNNLKEPEMDTSTTVAHTGAAWVLLLSVTLAVVLAIVAMWRIFTKAGKPGWAAIIPIYNLWVLMEVIGRPGWWAIILIVLGLIPVAGSVLVFLAYLVIALDLAKSFGKGPLFGIFGLWLFSLIGYLILAFGSAKYIGPARKLAPAAPVGPPPPAATPPAAPPPTPPAV